MYRAFAPPFLTSLLCSVACAGAGLVRAAEPPPPPALAAVPAIEMVLSHSMSCSATLVLRSEALSVEQERAACVALGKVEARFHALFGTQGKPVAHDHNDALRTNIYRDRASFERHAGQHFSMPTDNGGMYLEGVPERSGNHAEFVAYQRQDGSVHNLQHEYVHYLDGRFNQYGDFCAGLHDSHAGPEHCPSPAPLTPHLVWWSEGVAEYLAQGDENPRAIAQGKKKTYALSQLFDTSYEHNGGTERVYAWGYLAARYMIERQRDKVEALLGFTRTGDYPRAQALMRSWGDTLDEDFARWVAGLDDAPAQQAAR